MRVLVTGATGFVGSAIVGELSTREHSVIAVGGPRSPLSPFIGKVEADYFQIDVGDVASVKRLKTIGQVDGVIHAAGIAHRFGRVSPGEYQRINVDGVQNIAEVAAALGSRRFVLVSSVLVYGRKGRTPGRAVIETDNCSPEDVYAQSKLDGEKAAISICGSTGMPLTIVRPAPIVGEGSRGNFARLIRAIDKRRFLRVGRGENLKSLVYVGDVAEIVVDLMESSEADFEVYNLARDPIAVENMIATISSRLGKSVWPVSIPGSILRAVFCSLKFSPLRSKAENLSATLETWLAEDIYSNRKLYEKYGLAPLTPVEDAISREVESYLRGV